MTAHRSVKNGERRQSVLKGASCDDEMGIWLELGLHAQRAVSANLASQTGFMTVRQWLSKNNRLEDPGGGSSRGV